MRASKQFWVDQGNYNLVINNTPSGYGAKIDIREVIAADVLGVSITLLFATIVGIVNPVIAIGMLTVGGLAESAASGSLASVIT